MHDAESFEVQGTKYEQAEDLISAVNQIAEEFIPEHSGYNFRLKFMGENEMVITQHVCEVWLPHEISFRKKDLEERSEGTFSEYEKALKKNFKSRFGKTLKLKEQKDERTTSIQKVSLNDRYYFWSTRKYQIG